MIYLIIYALCIVFANCYEVNKDYGLCSQVYQMHQYCSGVSNFTAAAGPPGPPGPPGVVDYAAIKAAIDVRFAAMKAQIDHRLETADAEAEKLREVIKNLRMISSCDEALEKNAVLWNETGGVFEMQLGDKELQAYCDLTTDGGNWLVIQRRMDGSVDFYRKWNDYVEGFGDPDKEFWIGLEIMHQLTSGSSYEIRFDLEDWEGNKRYAEYSTFVIGDAASNYRLTIAGYSGNAGESMIDWSNGMEFSTIDRDNDEAPANHCAEQFKGAWWHRSCHKSNLNGLYLKGSHESYADGIEWKAWKGYYYSLKFTEMKIRPIVA